MQRLLCFRLIAAIVICGAAHSAHAQTVTVSNLGEASNGYAPVSYSSSEGSNYRYSESQSFATGPTPTFLSAITLKIFGGTGTGFSVGLYSNNNGVPGTLLETLAGFAGPTVEGDYSYTSGGSTTLSANTVYFWTASVPASGYAYFSLFSTASKNQTSSDGWTIGEAGIQTDISGTNVSTGHPFLFSVSTTSAIPEPSTYAAFAGLGALLVAGYRRRTGARPAGGATATSDPCAPVSG